MASEEAETEACLCLLSSEHEARANALTQEVEELLQNCEAMDAEATDFLQVMAKKTEGLEKQQLSEVGEVLADRLRHREGEKRLQQLAIRCRQLEDRFRRLEDEATELQQLLQQQQQQLSMIRAVGT
ncbi:hypothetical protein Efla_003556 [Eimeria flavescens]